MAKTLRQIEQQIAKLHREAETVRKKEVGGVIERIRTAVEHYGLTPQDVFGKGARMHGRARNPGTAAPQRSARGEGTGSTGRTPSGPRPAAGRDDRISPFPRHPSRARGSHWPYGNVRRASW